MNEHWMMFPVDLNGRQGFATVDTNAAEESPIGKLPLLMMLRVPFNEPGDDGLGSTEEADVITALEDKVDAALTNAFKAKHVGRVRGDGAIDLWFYIPRHAQGKAEEMVEKIMDGRAYECGIGEDAEWTMYKESLYPMPDQVQWYSDHWLIGKLASDGNDTSRARDLEFVAFMPNEEQARAFAEKATAQGFRITTLESTDENPELPFFVELVRHGPLDFEIVHPWTLALLNLAQEHDGVFDGWSALTDEALDHMSTPNN